MINPHGLLKWIKARVSWQLGLGLLISVLVHVCLLSQAQWLSLLSDDDAPSTVLQARLLIPPVPPPTIAPRPVAKPVHRGEKKPVVPPAPPPLPEAYSAPPASPTVLPVPVETSVAEENNSNSQEEGSAALDNAALDNAASVLDDQQDALPPPYQAVTTEYDVFVNGEDSAAGKASIVYAVNPDQQYALTWTVEGRGLLKLLYPKLVQESQGDVGPRGLKPRFYRYAFGQRANKTYEARFDWETRLLTLKTSKGEQSHDLPPNALDILSFMYQFMFMPPLQEMHVALTNGKRLGEYDYAFEGEETLQMGEQVVQTLHIAHSRGDTDEKIELWLASDYRYVPVKIRKVEKNGMVIEQVATSIQAR